MENEPPAHLNPGNAKIDTANPVQVASRSGKKENEVMLSRANRVILRTGNFVSPAWRAWRWYFTAV